MSTNNKSDKLKTKLSNREFPNTLENVQKRVEDIATTEAFSGRPELQQKIEESMDSTSGGSTSIRS